jgi:N-methylhydantoinase B
LYLYRREQRDSGGAGRFRAGNGGEIAYIPHKGASALGLYTTEAIPKTMGAFGGDPGSVSRTRVVRATNIREAFAAGALPQDLDTLGGTDEALVGKGTGLEIGDSDVLYWNWLAPGGYADPMTREPDLVAADVAAGAVSSEAADRVYAVVLGADGATDEAATAALRDKRLLARLRAAGAAVEELAPPRTPIDGEESIGDVYLVDRYAGELRCYRCGTSAGPLDQDPKQAMAVLERDVATLNPGWQPTSAYVDDEVVWRDYCCRGCGVRLATEVAYPGGDTSFAELGLG